MQKEIVQQWATISLVSKKHNIIWNSVEMLQFFYPVPSGTSTNPSPGKCFTNNYCLHSTISVIDTTGDQPSSITPVVAGICVAALFVIITVVLLIIIIR